MLKRVGLVVLYYFGLLSISMGQSDYVIRFNASTPFNLIGTDVYFLEDSTRSYTLEDLMSNDLQQWFVRGQNEYTFFDYSQSDFWIKFTIQNNSGHDLLIRIGDGMIALLDFYRPLNDGTYQKVETGYLRPFENRQYPLNRNMFKLAEKEDTQEKTFYLRANALGYPNTIPLFVATEEAMMKRQQADDWIIAVYVGAVFIMIIYNLFVFLSVREKPYLYYIFFLITICLMLTHFNGGYPLIWLYRDHGELSFLFFSVAQLNSIAWVIFIHYFLRLRWESNKLLRLVYLSVALLMPFAIINLIAGISGNYHWWTGTIAFTTFLFGNLFYLLLLLLIIDSFRRGVRGSRFILIGTLCYYAGLVIINSSQLSPEIPYDFLRSKSVILGSFLEISFFAIALSHKMKTLVQDKNEAHEIALLQAEENERIIREQNILLERKVEERTHKLNELVHEKNSLMGIVAHDLANPLNTIQGVVDLAREEKTGKQMKEYLEMISKVSANGRQLIRDLLIVGSSEQPLDKAEFADIEIIPFFEETLNPFKINAEKKQIELDVQFELVNSDVFHSDVASIRRIVENLVSNAIKFSPPNSKVTLLIQKKSSRLVIHIQDSGPGFTDRDRQQMFSKFKTLSARPTGGEQSTGLGLSIVKALCDRLNASINVSNGDQGGAVFRIELVNDAKEV